VFFVKGKSASEKLDAKPNLALNSIEFANVNLMKAQFWENIYFAPFHLIKQLGQLGVIPLSSRESGCNPVGLASGLLIK
jgi:hypothetical protein